MPGLLGGVEGVAAGAAGGVPGMILGGITGLFGGSGKPHEDPVTAQSRRLALQAQQQQFNFANSVPGSDPSELASLSQERGALGAAQRQQTQGLMGAYNPQMGNNGLADLLKNLSNSQVGQQMSLQESHLQNALFARRQALSEAANSGGRVAGPTYQPQSDLPQMLAKVAHIIAYQQGINGGDDSGNPGLGREIGQLRGTNTAGSPSGTSGAMPLNFAGPGLPSQADLSAGGVMPGMMPTSGGVPGGGVPNPAYTGAPGTTPWLSMGDDPSFNAQARAMGPPQQMQGVGSQPVNAMGGGFNIDGRAGLLNQWRQSNPVTGPAAQRFLVVPGGGRLPY